MRWHRQHDGAVESGSCKPRQASSRPGLRLRPSGGERSLTASTSNLDQVIVVGYGTQKKSDVTGSVARVTSATLAEVPTANFISELKGRTAGVDIVSNSSTPGGGGQIRIRGNRSMAQTSSQSDGLDQPLVVVDGIPFGGSVNDIDPDNIVSLDILKDASATAIYGSRGSGGVILITTRRGRVGKAQMNYNGYYGISSITNELHVFNGKEYAQFKQDAAALNTATPNSTGYPLTAAEQAGLTAGTNTDWQKQIERGTAVSTNHNLSFSGGSEHTTYSASVNYARKEGIIKNTDLTRVIGRLAIDQYAFNDRVKFSLNVANSYNNANEVPYLGVILLQAAHFLPVSPVKSPAPSRRSSRSRSFFVSCETAMTASAISIAVFSTQQEKS